MRDELILVNLKDEEVGYIEKLEAHRIPSLHRAFSVFLYKVVDGKIHMLLHKRAKGKYHSGGLWTNACCSHPRKGERINEAVARRMKEELGIETEVRELFSFTYYYRFTESCAEFEFDHVLVGTWENDVIPNEEEMSEVAWVEISELEQQIMVHPDAFTPWFLIAVQRVNEFLRKEAIQ